MISLPLGPCGRKINTFVDANETDLLCTQTTSSTESISWAWWSIKRDARLITSCDPRSRNICQTWEVPTDSSCALCILVFNCKRPAHRGGQTKTQFVHGRGECAKMTKYCWRKMTSFWHLFARVCFDEVFKCPFCGNIGCLTHLFGLYLIWTK